MPAPNVGIFFIFKKGFSSHPKGIIKVKVGKNSQVKVGENIDKQSLELHYYFEAEVHL